MALKAGQETLIRSEIELLRDVYTSKIRCCLLFVPGNFSDWCRCQGGRFVIDPGCLTFGGFYLGLADGNPGPLTDKAIKDFQRSIGRPETETGSLTLYDTSRLYEVCEEKKRRLGWAPYHLASTNITIELPLGILKRDQNVNDRQLFTGFDGAIRVSLFDTLGASLDHQNTICSRCRVKISR